MAMDLTPRDPLLKRRYRSERRFKGLCIGALALSVIFLVVFFADIINRGYPAFFRAQIQVEVTYDQETLKNPYLAVSGDMRELISRGFLRQIPNRIEANPNLKGRTISQWATAAIQVDQYLKGQYNQLDPGQQETVDRLEKKGKVELAFNATFFTAGDSNLPEIAGIQSAVVGSLYTLFLTMLVAFPIGVLTAVYLEEFASDNRFTRGLEANINNLAAVPSILYGLLGLAVFINFFGVPRSSAMAGGFTLALMTLPVVIISTRAALRAVPNSIREGAFGVGASRVQVVSHHVLPLSLPGILTGSIIGMAQAMGETAPLLIVGMIAFIPSPPEGLADATTVLPAQIYIWASRPERAFAELTAAGILVLLAVLLTLNATAVWLRRRFEHRW